MTPIPLALDLDCWAGLEQVMSEGKAVPMQIPHDVVADTVRPVSNRPATSTPGRGRMAR
jgi:hypothetical protein